MWPGLPKKHFPVVSRKKVLCNNNINSTALPRILRSILLCDTRLGKQKTYSGIILQNYLCSVCTRAHKQSYALIQMRAYVFYGMAQFRNSCTSQRVLECAEHNNIYTFRQVYMYRYS